MPMTETVREAYWFWIEVKDNTRYRKFGWELVARIEATAEFERWLASVKAEAWDEAVEALDRHHGDIYPIAVKSLDRRNPYREKEKT